MADAEECVNPKDAVELVFKGVVEDYKYIPIPKRSLAGHNDLQKRQAFACSDEEVEATIAKWNDVISYDDFSNITPDMGDNFDYKKWQGCPDDPPSGEA